MRREYLLGQFIQRPPVPLLASFRLAECWFSANAFCLKTDLQIVFLVGISDVVCNANKTCSSYPRSKLTGYSANKFSENPSVPQRSLEDSLTALRHGETSVSPTPFPHSLHSVAKLRSIENDHSSRPAFSTTKSSNNAPPIGGALLCRAQSLSILIARL